MGSKVYLEGSEYNGFARHLIEEGDDPMSSEREADVKIVQPSREIPGMILTDLGYPLVAKYEDETTHVLTRWWDSRKTKFLDQLMLSIPLIGLMNENLGPKIPVGSISRFLNPYPLGETLCYRGVEDILKEWRWNGFVSACMSREKIHRIELGIPYGAIFNAMENAKGKLSEWWSGEKGELREEWTVSQLISRTPFPYKIEVHPELEMAEIKGLTKNVEKHLWLLEHKEIRGVVYSTSSRVGYASSWGRDLEDASFRCLLTCRNVEVQGKQYRTDLERQGSLQLDELHQSGLLS